MCKKLILAGLISILHALREPEGSVSCAHLADGLDPESQ